MCFDILTVEHSRINFQAEVQYLIYLVIKYAAGIVSICGKKEVHERKCERHHK